MTPRWGLPSRSEKLEILHLRAASHGNVQSKHHNDKQQQDTKKDVFTSYEELAARHAHLFVSPHYLTMIVPPIYIFTTNRRVGRSDSDLQRFKKHGMQASP